jgi:hypothetical protein
VVESERLFSDREAPPEVARWLGLTAAPGAFPAMNEARREVAADGDVTAALERYFEPHNEELFRLLGYRMWGR